MEFLAETDMSKATVLASIVIANAGLILGAYVSMRERIKGLEVKVDNQEKDIDAAHEKIREIEKKGD